MVRNKHQIDSIDGKDSDDGLEAMISSFGLQEGLGLKTKPRTDHCSQGQNGLSRLKYGNIAH